MSYVWPPNSSPGVDGVVFGDATSWPPGFLTEFFYPQVEMLMMALPPIWQAFPDAQINSWYRDPDHNASIRPTGKPLSSHLLGLGVDIITPGGSKDDYDAMGSFIDGYVNDGTSGAYGPGLQPDRTYLVWTDVYEGLHLHVQVYYGGTPESFEAFNTLYNYQPWYVDWVAQYVSDPNQLAAINYSPDENLT